MPNETAQQIKVFRSSLVTTVRLMLWRRRRQRRRENRKRSQSAALCERCATLAMTCFWFSLQASAAAAAAGYSREWNQQLAGEDRLRRSAKRRSVPLERHIRLPADACHSLANHYEPFISSQPAAPAMMWVLQQRRRALQRWQYCGHAVELIIDMTNVWRRGAGLDVMVYCGIDHVDVWRYIVSVQYSHRNFVFSLLSAF